MNIIGKQLIFKTIKIKNILKEKGGEKMAKMTKASASRIQSHADRSGRNSGFKGRAQRAASKNSKK